MPDPTKDFWNKMSSPSEEGDVTQQTYAENNLTGLTPMDAPTADAPEGKYAKLHKEVGLDLFGSRKDWDEIGYTEQSYIDLAKNTVVGNLINNVSGFVGALGANDPKGLFDMATGRVEQDYKNVLMEWSDDLRKYSDKEFSIYQEGDGSVFTPEYWGSQLQSLGYSTGIIAEAFAEQALVAAATRGQGNVAGAAGLAKKAGTLGKLKDLLTSGSSTFGAFQGVKEAYMNGLETGQSVYEKYKESGYTEEEAKKKGNEAASLGFTSELLPSVILNSLQYATIGKYNPFSKSNGPNLGYSGAFETLSEYAFKGVKSKAGKKSIDYGTQIVSEMGEEGLQSIVGSEAQYKVLEADGLVSTQQFSNRAFGEEFRDSVIGGGLGGGVFRFMGKRLSTLTGANRANAANLAASDEYLGGIANRIGTDMQEVQQAMAEGDTGKANMIRKRMHRTGALEALEVDLVNQQSTAHDAYVNSLEKLQQAVESGDTEVLKEYGITSAEDIQYVTENFPAYIADAKAIKDKLTVNLEKYGDVGAALTITDLEQTREQIEEQIDINEATLQEFKTTGKGYKNLSPEAKAHFDTVIAYEKELYSLRNGKAVDQETKDRVDELQKKLKEGESLSTSDQRALKRTFRDYGDLFEKQANVAEYENALERIDDQISFWADPKNREEVRVEAAMKKIDNAKSKKEVEDAEAALKAAGTLTPALKAKAAAKKVVAGTNPVANSTPANKAESEYNKFVNTGQVSDPEVQRIADKIIAGEILTPEETAMRQGAAAQIEQILQKAKSTVSPAPMSTGFGTPVRPNSGPVSPTRAKSAAKMAAAKPSTTVPDVLVAPDDDLGFAPVGTEALPEVSEEFTQELKSYYTDLKTDLGKEPTFKEFIQDFVLNYGKDETDEIFRPIVAGWVKAGYPEVDFDNVYRAVFRSRKAMARSMGRMATDTVTTQEAATTVNVKEVEKVVEKPTPKQAIERKDTKKAAPIKDVDGARRTVDPTPKLAYSAFDTSRNFSLQEDGTILFETKERGSDVLVPSDVNSKRIMDPDFANAGEVLDIRIPTNYREIRISTLLDDYTEGPTMLFGDWMAANGVEEGTPEFYAKVPMIIFSQDGEGVAFVHDPEWYNGFNLGHKNDLALQAQIITEGRSQVMAIRDNVRLDSPGRIRITEKVRGTWKEVEAGSSMPTLQENNPDTEIALFHKEKGLLINGREPLSTRNVNLLNTESDVLAEGEERPSESFFQPWHAYEIRRGANSNDVIAFKPMRPTINQEAADTLKAASRVYLLRFDTESKFGDYAKNQRIRQEVINITGLDLHSSDDYSEFLRLYAQPITDVYAKDPKSTYNFVESTDEKKFPTGKTYMHNEGGTVIIGRKGHKVSSSAAFIYLNPLRVQDAYTKDSNVAIVNAYLASMDAAISSLVQNVSLNGLELSRSMVQIDSEGSVTPTGDYQTYIKSTLQTGIRSFNVGTKDAPVYATIMQPVVHYEFIGQEVTPQEKAEAQVPLTKVEEATVITTGFGTPVVPSDVAPVAPQEVSEELADAIEMYQEFFRDGLNENDMEVMQMAAIIRDLGGEVPNVSDIDNEFGFAPVDASYLQDADSTTFGRLHGLDILQAYQLTDYIFNQMSIRYDFLHNSSIATQELKDQITAEILEGKFKPLLENKKAQLKVQQDRQIKWGDRVLPLIESSKASIDALEKIIASWTFDGLKTENLETDAEGERLTPEQLEENKKQKAARDGFLDQGLAKFNKYTGTTVGSTEIIDDTTESDKVYSVESTEAPTKQTASYRLKRHLSGIQQVDSKGRVQKGFAGMPTYVPYDAVYDKIFEVLNNGEQLDSNFDSVLAKLQEAVKAYPWMQQVIDSIDPGHSSGAQLDDQVRQEFVYNFIKHNASYKFVMWSQNRDGSYKLKVYDSNSNDVLQVIRDRWKEKLKMTDLVTINSDGEHVINATYAKGMLEEYNSKFWDSKAGKVRPIKIQDLRDWTAKFGIELSEQTMQELVKDGMYNQKGKKVKWAEMFEPKGQSDGLFGVLADYLRAVDLADKDPDKSLEFITNDNMSPFNNIGNISKSIARIEAKYSLHTTTRTFRSGGKTFSGLIAPTHSSEVINKLKWDANFRMELGNKSFNGASYILDLLNSNEDFRENKFGINQLGNEAIKQRGQKVFGQVDITSLSDVDHELTKLGLFMDLQQGEMPDYSQHIGMRMARMLLPTMADKSRMSALQTAVFDIRAKHIEFYAEGDTKKSRARGVLMDIIYDQLIRPEINRITKFHREVGSTDIKGYDKGAQMFLMIPAINNIKVRIEENPDEVSILYAMKEFPSKYNEAWFENTVKPEAIKVLGDLVNNEVDSKVAQWEANGFVDKGQVSFLDAKYFNDNRITGSIDEKVKVAAYDFVVNSMITNANSYMLMAGDPAMYYTGKADAYFNDGEVWSPKEEYGDQAYAMMNRDVLGVNAGKRLALLIAPGIKVSESVWEKVDGAWAKVRKPTYAQLFLTDFIDHSNNLKQLAQDLDGKELTDKDLAIIKEVVGADTEGTKVSPDTKAKFKKLQRKFPNSSPYFELEATDAQEYTTAKEHLRVLYGQGRMPEQMFKDLSDKIIMQKAAEREGKAIPQEALFDTEEMQVFFQPVKPVYTGYKNEQGLDVMRTMYIKSSSFPLLPQVTASFELDGLRKLMEEYEEQNGTTMRASYQSANKVGASTGALNAFRADGTFNYDLLDDLVSSRSSSEAALIESAVLTLDRSGFKVQQDVPFDPSKSKVSQGTQVLKLLFGNGMTELDGFQFDGEAYTGTELKMLFDQTYDYYVDLKRKSLFDELGVDDTGVPISLERTKNKLQALLKAEAESRGYPRQDVEALEFEPRYGKDAEGNVDYDNIVDYEFKLPIWISQNSNRYESLLNAIVTNRLINLKMPGTSYVVGSEAGFQQASEIPADKLSRVIFTDKWTGSLQASRGDGKTVLNKAQVLAPSKLRDAQGNLIEFVYSDGTFNPAYVSVGEDGIPRIKSDMIAEELMSFTSFRTPTSGHVSMTQLEVVGFLPPEVGNLLITPKNLTQQMGQDFDIDKLTTYQHHSYVREDGTIGRLGDQQWLERKANVVENYEAAAEIYYKERDIKKSMVQAVEDEIDSLIEMGMVTDENGKMLNVMPEAEEKAMWKAAQIPKSTYTKKEFTAIRKVYKQYAGSKADAKVMENELVSIYASVLSNPSKEVQNKINSVLSMEFAKAQAELIHETLNANQDATYFTMLSDTYQKEKMYLGAAGKTGIGVYSNYVVFHSMTAQGQEPITLARAGKDENGNPIRTPLRVQFGSQVSNGELGRKDSLAGSSLIRRAIATVFEERQNTATDNEKEQIMGRVGVNEVTINVDALLSALGFDKDVNFYLKYKTVDGKIVESNSFKSAQERDKALEQAAMGDATILAVADDISIPYVFLSQPIIREYVSEIRKTRSSTTTYNPEAEAEIIATLLEKYQVPKNTDMGKVSEGLSGAKLFSNLFEDGASSADQTVVLGMFLELDKYGKKIGLLQRRLNINNSGLGKSYFETLDKYEALASFPVDFEGQQDGTKTPRGIVIENASAMIGTFHQEEDVMDIEADAMREQGYVFFRRMYGGGYWVKPRTPVGSMLVRGVHASHALWNKYFPYSSPVILKDIDKIVSQLSTEDTSAEKKVELRQAIFKDMRKYLLANEALGLHEGGTNEKRAELFIDNEDNQSLASYLSEVMTNMSPTYDVLRENKLLSKFEYQLNQNGLPSLITYNNSSSEGFDEDYLYVALIELMKKDLPLTKSFNGKQYTTRMLAEDLIAYSYLGEPVQEAIQFLKYVPVSYLNAQPFARILREHNENVEGRANVFATQLQANDDTRALSTFGIQYLQHNPQRLPKVTLEDHMDSRDLKYVGNGKDLTSLIEFSLDLDSPQVASGDAKNKEFVTVYNPFIKQGFKKFQVYKKVGDNRYRRISTLGAFGMSEYKIKNPNVVSLVNDSYKNSKPTVTTQSTKSSGQPFDYLYTKNLREILEMTQDGGSQYGNYLPRIISELLKNLPNIEVEIVDFTDKFGAKRGADSSGKYHEGKLLINSRWLNGQTSEGTPSQQKVMSILTHELIHGLTLPYLKKHLDADGNPLSANPPAEVIRLQVLLAEARKMFAPEVWASMNSKRKNSTVSSPLTQEELLAYGTLDVYELLAHAMSDPEFMKRMKDSKYKSTSHSIWDRFMDIITKMLNGATGSDLNADLLKASFTIIQAQQDDAQIQESVFRRLEDTQTEAEKTINLTNGFGKPVRPVEDSDNVNNNPEQGFASVSYAESNFLSSLKTKDC